MPVNEAFVIDVLAVVDEELASRAIEPTPQIRLLVIDNWIADYEDIEFLNRLERKLLNSLHVVRDYLLGQRKNSLKSV